MCFCYNQDLIDKAQTTLVGNCNLIQKMNASLGESTNGDTDDALADFNQVRALFFVGNAMEFLFGLKCLSHCSVLSLASAISTDTIG